MTGTVSQVIARNRHPRYSRPDQQPRGELPDTADNREAAPPRVRRDNTERYQWEKDRVLLDEAGRRRVGGTEHDTGLRTSDLRFHAEYDRVDADADLAAAFELPVGTPLLRRIYWTSSRARGAALSVSHSYLPYELASANLALLDADNEPWPGGTQHQLSTVDVELDRIVDRVHARPPSRDEADLLDLAPDDPVLAVRKTSIDTTGRVVEVADIVFPGDRTELAYATALKRWRR
ncbi:UTRA domain-containing protein [Micromonospora sp. NBC_01699]|uniref:UTRA domain-containing protein n=1 Tax=Micromonospora sp. NBC_01699 TaxID=2975984 RepID=UPI002E2E7350|nr:UTRA domain-containing protein [Micromonospora sp. NBC_01699]